jgi:IS30 family transposase
MRHYKHLTIEDRELSMVLLEKGFSYRQISRKIGCSPATISREISRNSKPNGKYSAFTADRNYHRRRRKCHAKEIFSDPDSDVSQYVTHRLRIGWTPEQISARAKLEGYPVSFSYVTIYRAIDNHLLDYSLKKCLRFKSHYKRHKKNDKRGKMQGITKISERPNVINLRSRIGDWESDTVLGTRADGRGIGTHVERKTGYLQAFLLDGLTSDEFIDKMKSTFSKLPRDKYLSFTVDRGKEFTNHQELAKSLGVPVYFCDPYSPWQKGTVENTNGLLRQFLPKKTSFEKLTQQDIDNYVNSINRRPRKRLGWRTPFEAFWGVALDL